MLFKNGVGRPSNKTLRNRKIVIVGAIAVIILSIFSLTYVFLNRDVSGKSKNATSGKYQLYSDIYKDKKDKNSNFQFISGCPVGYFHINADYCAMTTASSKNMSLTRFTNSIDYMAISQACKSKGYTSYKNVKNSFPFVRFTCYGIYKVRASELIIPYYNQRNYSGVASSCGGGNLPAKGCMPTSAAIVFTALSGKEKDPVWFNNYFGNLLGSNKGKKQNSYVNGFQVCTYDKKSGNQSYYAEALELYASKNGYKYENRRPADSKKIDTEASYLDSQLKTGKCMGIVALKTRSEGCKGSYCYSVGHFVVMSGHSNSGKVYIIDPYDNNYVFVEDTAKNIITYAQGNRYRIFCKK